MKTNKPFNPLEFKMKFKAGLSAVIIMSIIGILVLLILQGGTEYKELVKSIIIFFLGSVIGSVITFYFDGNESQQKLPEPQPLLESKLDGSKETTPGPTEAH